MAYILKICEVDGDLVALIDGNQAIRAWGENSDLKLIDAINLMLCREITAREWLTARTESGLELFRKL
jgi:hypothetical protein